MFTLPTLDGLEMVVLNVLALKSPFEAVLVLLVEMFDRFFHDGWCLCDDNGDVIAFLLKFSESLF